MNKNGAIYANIRGLCPKSDKSKLPYLADLAIESNSPFICLTETHLNPDILDAEITMKGYNLFRSDRSNRSHGGVCIYVRKDLAVKSEVKDSNSFCDSLILHIPQLKMILANIYRPPNCPEPLFTQTLEHASSFLRNMECNYQRANDYLIFGDFNFPFLNFKDGEHVLNNTCKRCSEINLCSHTTSERRQAQCLLNFANEFFLQQLIKKPTRNQNILDLVFTNNHLLINDYYMIVNSQLSDHYTICANLNYEKGNSKSARRVENLYHSKLPEYNFRDADEEDWMRLNGEFDKLNWDSLFDNLPPAEMTETFLTILQDKVALIFKKLPQFENPQKQSDPIRADSNRADQNKDDPNRVDLDKKKESFSSNNKIPRKIRILMRNKSKISKSIQRIKSVPRYLKLRSELESIEKQLKDSYDKRRMKQEKEALSKMKKDPKAFYNYAKKFSKATSDIGPFMSKEGNVVADAKTIADMLKEQYESVYSTPFEDKKVTNPQEFFSQNSAAHQIDSFNIDREDIIDALDKLGRSSSAGPDGVPSILLKNCKRSLSHPLLIMFRNFKQTGIIPPLLKEAFVIPIHKGGIRSDPANFRPVSLTSHIIKTMERIIRKSLVGHLEFYQKLNPSQHGFRNQRSCLSQLLEHHDKILGYLEDENNVDSIYLDFSKAFDKVDIGILCHKLRAMGVAGKLGVWLHNFLSNRKQFIIANGHKSDQSDVKSGVPQGTVLGPILFLILINDINIDVQSDVSLFADDTRIVKPVNNIEDVEALQEDLENLYSWQEKNNMAFNGKKFEMLRYGRNENLKIETNYLTPKAEDIIEIKECLRDLGIQMSDDAKFDNHIAHVCSKVRQKCGWILRTFNCRSSFFMKFMWKSLVQGHIDYCSQLYFPNQSTQLEKIEDLQKTFTKKIPEVQNLDYWTRLKHLQMLSQQRRAERYKIIYTWKVIEGLVPNCGINWSISERRGRECQIPPVKCRNPTMNLREQSFQVSGPKLFNCLPKYLRNRSKVTKEEFKEELDQFLGKIPDQPKIGDLVPSVCDQITARPSNSLVDVLKRNANNYGGA